MATVVLLTGLQAASLGWTPDDLSVDRSEHVEMRGAHSPMMLLVCLDRDPVKIAQKRSCQNGMLMHGESETTNSKKCEAPVTKVRGYHLHCLSFRIVSCFSHKSHLGLLLLLLFELNHVVLTVSSQLPLLLPYSCKISCQRHANSQQKRDIPSSCRARQAHAWLRSSLA